MSSTCPIAATLRRLTAPLAALWLVLFACSSLGSGCSTSHRQASAAECAQPEACVDAGADITAMQGHTRPKCNATPTKLIDAKDLIGRALADADIGVSAAMDLAVTATDLYVAVNYTEDGEIFRVPIRGGAPLLVARVAGTEEALLVTRDSVVFAQSHWAENDDVSGEIVRVGLHGGDTTVLATGRIALSSILGPSGVLASDGHSVYFATSDGIQSVALNGGPQRMLTTHTGSLAIVGSKLVIADGTAGAVFSLPLDGGDTTTLATNLKGYLGPVLSCGADICWASAVEGACCASGTGAITRLDARGSMTALATSDGLFVVHRLVFDQGDFFGTTLGDASFGAVFTVPANNDSPLYIASGSGFAIDDECIYTGEVLDGIYSVDKAYRPDAM